MTHWLFPRCSIGLALVALIGCAAAPDDDDDSSAATLERVDSCEKTHCEESRDECEADVDECSRSCLAHIEYAESCYDVCRSIDCPYCGAGSDSSCVLPGYEFRVTGAVDPAVLRSCEAYVRHASECEGRTVNISCAIRAATLRPDSAAQFSCFAEVPCGADDDCPESPVSDLGDAFCRRVAERCPAKTCSVQSRLDLNGAGGLFKGDAVIEALACAEEPCEGIYPCVNAWVDAVFGQ